MPEAATGRRRNTFRIERPGEFVQTHAAGNCCEHPPDNRSRNWVFIELSLGLVAPSVPVWSTAARDELAAANSGDPAAYRALRKLFSLDLCSKRLSRTDELADGGLLKLLSHKFQARSRMGDFLGKNRDVSLLT